MRNPHDVPDRVRSIETVVDTAVADYCVSGINCHKGLPSGLGTPDDLLLHNLVQNPAHSAVRSKGPLIRTDAIYIASPSEPEVVGAAGRPGAHILFDGTEFIRHTGILNNYKAGGFPATWHIDGDFTVYMMLKFKAGSNQTLFATKANGSFPGVHAYRDASNKLAFVQYGATGSAGVVTSTATITNDTIYCLSIDHDHSGNTTGFRLGNSTRESVAHTFNAATTANPASTPLTIGAQLTSGLTTAGFFLAANTELYDLAFTNAVESDADAADIFALFEARSGVDGTP